VVRLFHWILDNLGRLFTKHVQLRTPARL
jgi:hypothetical protein